MSATLKRLVGIQFEFKRELKNFFTTALANKLVLEYNSNGNTPSARTALKDKFVACGPSMGFEARKFAYGTLELIVKALVNNPDVPTDPYVNRLNSQLVNIARYVGLEGEANFHFMVAVHQLSVTISDILTNVVPVGAILTLTLTTGGTGYTTNGSTSTATGVKFSGTLAVQNRPSPSQYVAAAITGNISSGVITTITAITSGGNGFAVGSVISLSVDTSQAGQTGGTGTGGTATVNTIS
jgi:hypothetical protein